MYPVSDGFLRAVKSNTRKYYWTGTIVTKAGVSYEFIRLAGRYDNWFVNILSKPGLWMQGLTTKEPDDDMIEVGIASVEAVFDWKKWQKEEYNS